MFNKRKKLYELLESRLNTKIIAYATSDRANMQTQISSDTMDIFLEHLDKIGNVPKISLILYTLGGDTLAAWNIVNLVREFCTDFEIIVPNKCRSAGTLMCLGANDIIMTKQATLGPIDPSLNSPMNPIIPGSVPPQPFSVSVESIKGYFDLLKNEVGANDNTSLSAAFVKLTDFVNPLVLGNVYRVKNQIKMLAEKLLKMHRTEEDKLNKIVSFLCSDSGSHDYTLNRTEARQLGLEIQSPDFEMYKLLKSWHADIVEELKINEPYNVVSYFYSDQPKNYCFKRGFIESINEGSYEFVSEGVLSSAMLPSQQVSINDNRKFEGWRKYVRRTSKVVC